MNKQDIAIATMTWARSPAEADLLQESLQALSKLDVPIYLADGGSESQFISFVQSLPNTTLVQTTGMGLWRQVHSSLVAAHQSGKRFILYTEPDKSLFFSQNIQAFIADAPAGSGTGVALASRTNTAFQTFPTFQQTTETTINFACGEVTGQNLDYTYGPFIFNSLLLPLLHQLPDHIHWGWRPYLFCIAHRLGYTITDYPGNFECPADQRSDTAGERIYRLKQLQQNIEGVVLAASGELS